MDENIQLPLEQQENNDFNSEVIKLDFERDVTLEHSEHSHRHHHHHHHDHHSHKSSSSKKKLKPKSSKTKTKTQKKDSKFKKFLKKKKFILLNILFALIIIALVFVIAFDVDSITHPENNNVGEELVITEASVEIESTIYTQPVKLIGEAVSEYMAKDKSGNSIFDEYVGSNYRLDVCSPLEYSFNIKGLPSGVTVVETVLEVSENSNFTNSLKYNVDETYGSLKIYNLKTGTKYYYRLNATLSSGTQISQGGSFTTEASPRILTIDGIRNVRDIGGWKTASGKTIKQGLLFRGTELDGAFEEAYTITEDGIAQMRYELGIKYDLDLRGQTLNTKDMLGNDVEHNYYNVSMYSGVLNEGNTEAIRKVFSDLANKNNYPMYLHCTYGRDRTGTVCYLLEGLLGVSDYDLRKDYELTMLYDGSDRLDEFISFTTLVNTLEGANTQEKIEGYLLSIGVTEQEIANIREIFLG